MPTKVQDQSPEVMEMSEHWPVLASLLGGTSAMRKSGKALLPKEPREDEEDYRYRLAIATLFPAYERTISVMAGKPFSKPLTLGEDVPPALVEYCEDIDQQGRNLHAFSAGLMQEVLGFGLAGVLIDYPSVPETVKTQAVEKAIGARPYFVHVRHDQILGWKSKRVNGSIQLIQLRLFETAEIEDGNFGVRVVKRVRVLIPGGWALYQENDRTKEFDLIEEGKTTLSYIPFVPFYGIRKDFMVGMPPLLNLAYQNVKHWQAQSDQDDSARFARKRILVFAGVSESDLKSVTAASNFALRFDSPATTVTVVQGSAESVTVGRTELKALEDQMIQTGAELLVAQPGQRTATEANNDAEANKSQLLRIVEAFEDALDTALQMMADWLHLPDGGHVTLFKDFTAATLSDASAQLIVTMQQGGLITKQTTLAEMQRRGLLSPDIVPDDEVALVSEMGPSLGMLGDVSTLTPDTQTQPIAPVLEQPPATPPVATPPTDLKPLIDSIGALVAQMSTPDPVEPMEPAEPPTDLSPIVAKLSELIAVMSKPEAPEVPEVPLDLTPIANAILEGMRSIPAPVVNLPTINVSPSPITIEAAPAPNITMPPINVTIEKSGKATFTNDANGNIVGATLD